MALTVNSAFLTFLTRPVRLDPDDTKLARKSRDWLKSQIKYIGDSNNSFPKLWEEFNLDYGSFSRRTKIIKIDDIDMMIGLHAESCTYLSSSIRHGSYKITTKDKTRLDTFSDNNILNSRKIINKFVSELSNIPQYQNAEIKRTGQAATLKLKSYDWNFDVVPCFHTSKDSTTGREYYLIPDGNGEWMMTDPSVDQYRVTTLNQVHNGIVLDVIRLIKYWNKRPTMPSSPSYLIECIVLDYFTITPPKNFSVQHIYGEALQHVSSKILGIILDPKSIDGDINTLSYEDRLKIHQRANADYTKAISALNSEYNGDQVAAINTWREVFGQEFPTYG